MATFKKLESGKWQAQVARVGVRRSKSFRTKREAQDWASRQEYLITVEGHGTSSTLTFADLMDRYAREESPKKRGARWEILRLMRLKADRLAQVRLSELDEADFADWRDRRLQEVSKASVRREMVLMSGVLTVARKEWKLMAHNPIQDVRKPSPSPPRDRRVPQAEIDTLTELAGADLTRAQARAIHAFRFAIETAMRAGEILSLRSDTVDLKKRVAHLPNTKNGSARDVPLSSAAVDLLKALPDADGNLFNLDSKSLDTLFRRMRDRAGIRGLRFHDSRHEATHRLSNKVEVLDLARILGHKDLNMLIKVYYHPKAEDIAKLLD